jgi:hypothetical protein
VLKTHGSYRDALTLYDDLQADMQELCDDMLFRHVDDAQYYHQLLALRKAFEHYTHPDYQALMCAIQSDFSETEEEQIAASLK